MKITKLLSLSRQIFEILLGKYFSLFKFVHAMIKTNAKLSGKSYFFAYKCELDKLDVGI